MNAESTSENAEAVTKEISDVSVYRINPCEWWAARTLDEAIEAAMQEHGLARSEVLDELAPPYRLAEEEMESTLVMVYGFSFPFKVELQRLLREGYEPPFFFGKAAED